MSDKPIIKGVNNPDDFRVVAGIWMLEEVDRLVDKLEALDFEKKINEGIKATLSDAQKELREQSSDPLNLTSEVKQAKDVPVQSTEVITLLVAVAGGMLLGILGTFLVLT